MLADGLKMQGSCGTPLYWLVYRYVQPQRLCVLAVLVRIEGCQFWPFWSQIGYMFFVLYSFIGFVF